MIISHRHKFIFIKTAKTAGTSIEIALSQFCGPEDIITPISTEDEATRKRLGYPGPQNYLAPLRDYMPLDFINLLVRRKKKKRYNNHIAAARICKHLEPEIWQNYYKFCFERNPWDKVVSLYFWRHRREPRPDFAKFAASRDALYVKRKGWGLYTLHGEVCVDKVCRFEEMEAELAQLQERLQLPGELHLLRAKSGTRTAKYHYSSMYKEAATRERIALAFKEEIKLLDYEFTEFGAP